MSAPAKIVGFMHVATHGPWRAVVDELFDAMKSSGLHAKMDRLHLTILGSEPFEPADDKVSVIHRSPDFLEYEFPTLSRLHQFCASNDASIFYVHTKGVFRTSEAVDDWRRYMTHFVITRHQDCLDALADHDVCGVNWHTSPWPHFSGNFWWARSSYIRTLPAVDSLPFEKLVGDHEPRHNCERWIGVSPAVRVKCFFESGLKHYTQRFPAERYVSSAGDADD